MRRYLLVAAATGGCVLAATAYFRQPPQSHASPLTRMEDVRLAAAVTALNEKVAMLEQVVSQGKAAAQPSGGSAPAPEDPAVPAAPSPEPPEPPEPPTEEEVRLHMDATFGGQQLDPGWGPSATRSMSRHISLALPPGSSTRAAECKESICRVETAHQSLDSYREFVTNAFVRPREELEHGPTFTTLLPNPDGSVTSVSYVARPGYTLPVPEATANEGSG